MSFVVIASLAWFDSVAHATLLLAGATVVLAVISACGTATGRRAADAATRAAEAAEREAKASTAGVEVAREGLARAHRPVLTDIPERKYIVYGLPVEALVVPGAGSGTVCRVPLQNVGTGTAVIEHEEPCPAVQVRMTSQWYRGTLNALILPVGETIKFEGTAAVVPTADPKTQQAPTVYVRVAYTDLAGNRFVTYLCLMMDEETTESLEHADRWSVHGVAFDDGRGLVQSGDGWDGFTP